MPEQMATKRLVWTLWAGVLIQLVGRAIDGRWHAMHEHFETAGDQVEAHLILWIGVLVTLLVSALTAKRLPVELRSGWPIVLVGSGLYVVAAAWHFWEHSRGVDPLAPHIALGVVWATLLGGALMVTLWWRRQARG